MLENIVSSLLSHFLEKYIDKLNGKDLKLSLFSGKVSLNNLSIKTTALMEHQLPFKVSKGIIKEILLSIPYRKLKSQPCVATINEILILGRMCGRVLMNKDSTPAQNFSEYGELDEALKEQDVSKGDLMSGMVGTIIDNLQVNISNVHVRLEYMIGHTLVAIGIIIPLIHVSSVDENGKEITVNTSGQEIRKKLTLIGLSIYIDTNCSPIDTENTNNFQIQMLNSINDKRHQYILHDFSIDALYRLPKSGTAQFGNILSITTKAINLALDSFQYRCIMQLNIEQIRFSKRKFYFSCGRPDEFPNENDNALCQLWWQFSAKCSHKKKNPITFDPKNALIFLKNRKAHLARLSEVLTKPNKKKDESYLKDLQKKFGPDVFILFRVYAKFMTERELKQKASKSISKEAVESLKSENFQEIVSQNYIIKNTKDTIRIIFEINEINVGLLYSSNEPLALFQLKGLSGNLAKLYEKININGQVTTIFLINKKDINNTNIIKLNSTEATNNNCGIFNFNGNLQRREFNIDYNAASPEFYADFAMIGYISNFFDTASDLSIEESAPKIKKRDMTTQEIQNAIENHALLNLNIHFESPIIRIPSKTPINIILGTIDIKTKNTNIARSIDDQSSWYDEFALEINGFHILMDNVKLCNPVNIGFSLAQSFVRSQSIAQTKIATYISSIEFILSHHQLVELLQLPELFSLMNNTSNPNQKKITQSSNTKSNPPSLPINSVLSDLSLSFDFKFEKFQLSLIGLDESSKSEVNVAKINVDVNIIQEVLNASFILQFIEIHSWNEVQICKFGSFEEPAIKAKGHMKGISIDITLFTSNPEITADIMWIKGLLEFFDIPLKQESNKLSSQQIEPIDYKESKETDIIKKIDYNQYQLERQLQNHPIINLDLNIGAPIINIPNETPITIKLGSFSVKTTDFIQRNPDNIESFYDNFELKLTELEIKIGEEFILDPFSTKIDIHKAFIVRKDIQAMRVILNIDIFKFQLKQSQFRALLGVIDSFSELSSPNSKGDTKEIIDNQLQTQSRTSSIATSDITNMIVDSDNTFSVFVNFTFDQLQMSLVNEDNTPHTLFEMSNMKGSFDSLQGCIKSRFMIDKLIATSGDLTLLSFGENEVKSINFEYKLQNDIHFINCFISKPTLNVDFFWIFQIQTFFEMPQKANSLKRSNTVLNESSSSTNKTNQNAKEISSKDLQPHKSTKIPIIKGNFCIDKPSIKMVLVKKGNMALGLRLGLETMSFNINDSQVGSFTIRDIQLSVDERFLMTPFTIDLNFQLHPDLKISLKLDEIILRLQMTDYQLLLEISEYIESSIFYAKEDSYAPNINDQTPNATILYDNGSIKQNLAESSGNEKDIDTKAPIIDIQMKKVGIEILDNTKLLFNFEIQEIVASTINDTISVNLKSIICQEHVSCESNDLVLVSLNIIIYTNGNIFVEIGDNTTVFLKMEAVQALLTIFAPREQILEYKPNKKKSQHTKAKKVNNSNENPLFEQNKPTSILSVKGKCLKVSFLDDTEILKVLLKDVSYINQEGIQNILIKSIEISDSSNSRFYPSELLRNESGNAVAVKIDQNIDVDINYLVIFANLDAINRVYKIILMNPLTFPKSNNSVEQEDMTDQNVNNKVDVHNNNNNSNAININLNSSKITFPVLFNQSNDMLEIMINAGVQIESDNNVECNIKNLSARFVQYNPLAEKRQEHPPFIKDFHIIMQKAMNSLILSMEKFSISIAPSDIASINVLINSITKFSKDLVDLQHTKSNSKSSQNLVVQTVKKSTKSIIKKTKNYANDIKFIISVKTSNFSVKLNSDRYHTVPLFRFQIKTTEAVITTEPGAITAFLNIFFDSIDFMEAGNMHWKMIAEPSSLAFNFTYHTEAGNFISKAIIEKPININISYNAIALILKHSKHIMNVIQSKKLYDTEPPNYTIKNKSCDIIQIQNPLNQKTILIHPNNIFQEKLKRESSIPIKIDNKTIVINAEKITYPFVFNQRTVISQKQSESGTKLTISSILLFKNQTSSILFLLKQKKMKSFEIILGIPPSQTLALPILGDMRNMKFALTSDHSFTNVSHSTFDLKTIKKRAILLECIYEKNIKKKLVVSSKFKSQSCSMIVKIEPNCILRNQLPTDLFVRASGERNIHLIQEGQKAKLIDFDGNKGSIPAYFATGTYMRDNKDKITDFDELPIKFSKKTEIKTKDGSISPIELTFSITSSFYIDVSTIVTIAVEAKCHPKKPIITLVFYAPSIIFNRTGLDIICVSLKQGLIKSMTKFAPREQSSDPRTDGFSIWSNTKYFDKQDKRTLPLFLFSPSTSSKDVASITKTPIECTVSHVDAPIFIPTSCNDLYVPLHYTISSAEPFAHSTIVTLTSQSTIQNCLNYSIFVYPIIDIESNKYGNAVEIKPQTSHVVRLAPVSLLFALKFTNDPIITDQKDFTVLNLSEPIHTTFSANGNLIEIQNQALGTEVLTILKPAIIPQPIMLTNDLENGEEEIIVIQKDSKKVKCVANPQTTVVVPYEDPFGCSDLILYYRDQEIPIDLVHVNIPQQYSDVFVEIFTNSNNTKSIIVSRSQKKHKIQKVIDIQLTISTIFISLIDKMDREFMLLTIQKLFFNYQQSEYNTIKANIGGFQLDDLHPLSLLRVVAAGYPDENDKDFLDFSIKMFPNAPLFTSCKDISLNIEPVVLFLDLSFLSDALYLIDNLILLKKSSSNLLKKPKPIKPSRLSSMPLSAENFLINEIKIILFVRSKTPRPFLYPSLSNFLKSIPEITNGKITLPSFHLEECTMNAAYIQKEIVKPLINAAIVQGMKMLFNTDIFMPSTGTNSANFAKRFERLKDGQLQVLVQVPGSMILQGGEAVVNVASKLVHFATFDNTGSVNRVNTTAKDTMIGGLKALGGGFIDGITGVVMTPIQMGQEKGAGGAFVGIAKGLVGLVTKPVAGVLDAGVATFAATRKAITGEDSDVIPPIRIARALPMVPNQGIPTQILENRDLAQCLFQRDGPYKYKELIEVFLIDVNNNNCFSLTQHYIFMSDFHGNIKDSWKIKKILNATSEGNVVKFTVKEVKTKTICINSTSNEYAYEFANLINSRKLTLAIGD